MYQPNYQITDRLLMDLVKLEQDKIYLDTADYNLQTKKDLMLKSKSVNMFHLAHMIGVDLTIKDAEKAVEGKKLTTTDARGTIMNNFRNVMEFVRSNVTESYVDVDLNLLLHLNKIILTDWKEIWEAKFRMDTDTIDPALDNWVKLRDESLKQYDMEQKLNDAIYWYKINTGKIHPIIRIAVLIYELVRTAPFVHCNELTTISIADFLLKKNNYLDKTFLPIVREFDLHDAENIDLWKQSIENDGDITTWLERFVQNLSSGISEDREKILQLTNTEKSSNKKPFLDLNRRQLKILRYLQTIPTVKREDYVQMMDVSTMTAFRDMTDLCDKKLLKIEGKGRGTKYMLATR